MVCSGRRVESLVVVLNGLSYSMYFIFRGMTRSMILLLLSYLTYFMFRKRAHPSVIIVSIVSDSAFISTTHNAPV